MLFFHFSKICEHARFVTRSEQNYESDSSEIFTVAIYENVLHDSNSLLQYRHHRAVRLSTYRTALIYGKSYIRYIYIINVKVGLMFVTLSSINYLTNHHEILYTYF